MTFYTKIIKPIAFKMDAERTHDNAIFIGRILGSFWLTRKVLSWIYCYENEKLRQNILGIEFKNPVGLAGGFDKNGKLTDVIPCIGFGFMETGSITGERCEGNKKPRMWRLVKDKSIAVHYGLCNDGAEVISERLRKKSFKIPLGMNIAKTNDSKIKGKDSIEDYYKGFNLTKSIGDFFVINISCPNTGDGCSFENPEMLDDLLARIDNKKRVVFLKLGNDLSFQEIDKILKVISKYNVSGFVLTNLSKKSKELKSSKEELQKIKGGLSGIPARKRSNEIIKYIYKKTKGKYIIIGLGGIFSAEDAYEKIKNGASLVELITGMIYEGPGLIKKINKGLVELLEKDGFENISQAVGVNVG